MNLDVRCFHSGYLPVGTKVVYGAYFTPEGYASNHGNYYYLKDTQYLYDFCHFVSKFEVEDEYDFFDLIEQFLRKYFGIFKKMDREEMFQLLCQKDGSYFPLNKEHDLNWFQGKGNAMCSEFAVMAQNILALFDFDTYLMIGQEQVGRENEESHAFNLVSFLPKDSSRSTNLLLDFANYVNVYNFSFQKVGEAPFIGVLETIDDDFIRSVVYDDKHLTFEDYHYYFVQDQLFQIAFQRIRDYFVGNELFLDAVPIKKKEK